MTHREPEHDTGDVLACSSARELVSAAADDELAPSAHRRLTRHLDGCADCARYAERVALLTRSVRLRPAQVPVARVPTPPRLGRGGWVRPALAWVGIVVMVQGLRPLVLGDIDGVPTHVARHVGATALALGIGLLFAAWRPVRAVGLLPFAAALFAATSVAAVLDMAAGDRQVLAETVHLAELVGIVLLWFVAGSPGWDRVVAPGRGLRNRRGVRSATN